MIAIGRLRFLNLLNCAQNWHKSRVWCAGFREVVPGEGGAELAWRGPFPVLVGCRVSWPRLGAGSAVWYGGAGLRGGLPGWGGGAPCPGLVGWVVARVWSAGGVGQPRVVSLSSFWCVPVPGPCGVVVAWGLGSPGAGCVGLACRNQGGVVSWCYGVSAHR